MPACTEAGVSPATACRSLISSAQRLVPRARSTWGVLTGHREPAQGASVQVRQRNRTPAHAVSHTCQRMPCPTRPLPPVTSTLGQAIASHPRDPVSPRIFSSYAHRRSEGSGNKSPSWVRRRRLAHGDGGRRGRGQEAPSRRARQRLGEDPRARAQARRDSHGGAMRFCRAFGVARKSQRGVRCRSKSRWMPC
jgi:hypothetical protein